ncbi:MAG: hypothetical protein J5483_04090 [Lachnospiraceae bacterium]|nr:hypothetical protein [Lachnospiraceae bacterium]
MKKILTILIVGALGSALLLAACGKNTDQPADQPAGSGTSSAKEPESMAGGALLGGWIVTGDMTSQLTDDERAVFDQAIDGLVGAEYEPISIIATQLVAGMNYAYLCTTTPVVPDSKPHWTIAVVYKDLQGNASLSNVADLELTDVKTLEQTEDQMAVGAWEITEPSGKPVMLPSEEAQTAFDKATENYAGVGFKPIALLGTQLVAGTNYKVLCWGTLSTSDAATHLYVVDIYADLQGNAEITNVGHLDLLTYITPPIE